jgi:uncharacterized membrane protein YqjE
MAALDNLGALIGQGSRLLEQHLQLARLELKADAREIGTRVGVIAALMPLVLVGYGFLCAALAMVLGRSMGLEAAVALVGAVNLLGAIVGIYVAAQQLKEKQVLGASAAELEATSAAVRGPAAEGGK